MWKAAFVVYTLSALCELLWAHDGVSAITPQDCSLDCIQQGGPGCEYCRITREHIQKAVGFNSIKAFGSCIPWPCFDLLGKEDPQICQHFVQAPNNLTVEFVHESDPISDTIVVSWKPSYYGIAFLRGFQVSLQALGGSSVACQLFLFHRNLSLPTSHAERVYKSDPFPSLSLDSQYAVTVMALPVPEEWERFYHSKVFSTRSCAEKNGLEHCKKDWYPKDVKVQQGTAINVTFNLAPPNLGITSYFLLCYANGMKKYTVIRPNLSKNKTHHSYLLNDLQGDTNYTCQIAADEVDAVRRTFNVHVMRVQKEGALSPRTVSLSLAVILPLFLTVAAIFVVWLAALNRKRSKVHIKKLAMEPVLASYEEQSHGESSAPEEVVSVPRNRLTPPHLLICYSRRDGPAHVNAIMRLGAFIQQHMATQVILDLWETLSVAREGSVAWYCRHIRESDFILVVCSRGLSHRPAPPEPERADLDEEAGRGLNFESDVVSSDAAVQFIEGEVVGAKARGQDLSKYMVALFEYSKEADIPSVLRLVSQYTLTTDLELLFSHLHGIALHKPGRYLKINNVTEEGFTKLPAGAALQQAIGEARMEIRVKNRQSMEGGD